jgi:hypothetical protein
MERAVRCGAKPFGAMRFEAGRSGVVRIAVLALVQQKGRGSR